MDQFNTTIATTTSYSPEGLTIGYEVTVKQLNYLDFVAMIAPIIIIVMIIGFLKRK